MSIKSWLYGGPLVTHTVPTVLSNPKEATVTFSEFTKKYFGATKFDKSPYVFPADTMLVAAQTGLAADEVTAYVDAWRVVQEIYVKNHNRMPNVDEVIHEYNLAHGIAEPVPVPVHPPVVPDRTPQAAKSSPFYNAFQARVPADPEDALVGSLSVRQFRALLDEILDAAIVQPAAAADANAAMRMKLEAALAALK